MFKTLAEKINKFAVLHPQLVVYGINIDVTFGIALAVSFALSPNDAFASTGSASKAHNV
jgi:hypothetical protein